MKSEYKWVSVVRYQLTQYYLVNSKEFDIGANCIYVLARLWRFEDELELITQTISSAYFPPRYRRPADRILIPKVLSALKNPEFSAYKQILLDSISDRNCDVYKAELL